MQPLYLALEALFMKILHVPIFPEVSYESKDASFIEDRGINIYKARTQGIHLSPDEKTSLRTELTKLVREKSAHGRLYDEDYRDILEELHTKVSGSCKKELDRAGFKTISKYSLYPTWLATDKISALSEWLDKSDHDTAIDSLRQFLRGTDGMHITRDTVNPNIFTVMENGKKAYWFLNVINGQYQKFIEYGVKKENNVSSDGGSKMCGIGAFNKVYSRGNVPSLAIRKPLSGGNAAHDNTITRTHLMLSLLYSMKNYKEILQYINLGFIKSSKKHSNSWKMVIPAIQGGTLTQMFGTKNRSKEAYYYCGYGTIGSDCKIIVEQAKLACENDLKRGTPLAGNLEEHYQAFCEHAKQKGYLVTHTDLEPYNVMYNTTNHCLTLIDGDSWKVVKGAKHTDELMLRQGEKRRFEIIKNHR